MRAENPENQAENLENQAENLESQAENLEKPGRKSGKPGRKSGKADRVGRCLQREEYEKKEMVHIDCNAAGSGNHFSDRPGMDGQQRSGQKSWRIWN